MRVGGEGGGRGGDACICKVDGGVSSMVQILLPTVFL